jgi:hypothetical protein
MGRLNNAVPPQAGLLPVVAAEIQILVEETMRKHKGPGRDSGIVKDGNTVTQLALPTSKHSKWSLRNRCM